MDPIETYEYKDCKIEIHRDNDPMDPREWDNLCRIWCWHRKYDLGDKHAPAGINVDSWGEIEEFLFEEESAVEIIPLYLYDHSGLVLSTKPLSCAWDSGQVSFAFITAEDVMREYGEVALDTLARAKKVLDAEVQTYCDYINGDVYGFRAIDRWGRTIDSCWGFYGDASREDSDMVQDAKTAIDAVALEYERYIERLRVIAAAY